MLGKHQRRGQDLQKFQETIQFMRKLLGKHQRRGQRNLEAGF